MPCQNVTIPTRIMTNQTVSESRIQICTPQLRIIQTKNSVILMWIREKAKGYGGHQSDADPIQH